MDFEQDDVNDQVEESVEETTEEIPHVEESEEAPQEEEQEASQEEETEDDGQGDEDGAEDDEASDEESEGAQAYKPNTKFKTTTFNPQTKSYEQKELEIDKRFHGLMKDPESEKMVRELHEKAAGLDTYKDRYARTNQELVQERGEKSEILEHIDEARQLYQSAVKTGNYLKLDRWLQKLQVPYQVIENYVRQKLELAEMDPSQRNAILGQMQQEDLADQRGKANRTLEQQMESQKAQTLALQLQFTLSKPEVVALQTAFESQTGKPGSFEEAVRQEGTLAWYQKEELTPEQAVQRVVQKWGLKAQAPSPGGQQKPAGGAQNSGKKVVQRTTASIPNMQGRSASPLKAKPKSIADLQKAYDNIVKQEQG